jgi:hypothetical protein
MCRAQQYLFMMLNGTHLLLVLEDMLICWEET